MNGLLLKMVGLLGYALGIIFLFITARLLVSGQPFGVAALLTVFSFIAGLKVSRSARRTV